jgi:predicted lipoprotein with Yx(FWY)xxD motif
MRKSGWTVAAGLGSLLLLLTACGGSSSSTTTSTSTTTGAAAGSPTQSTASSSSSGPATSSTSSSPRSTANSQPTSSDSSSSQAAQAQAQPSSNAGVTFPPVGTTVLIVQHSNLGWVMAKADGLVVYTYARDSRGGPPTCTGSCASVWAPVTGVPKAGPADTFPGTFGLVRAASGTKVITYNGYPLYTLAGAPPLTTKGNGVDGAWHVIILSAADISGG